MFLDIHTQIIVFSDPGFSCEWTKEHHKDLIKIQTNMNSDYWAKPPRGKSVYPLLLDVDNGIMDCDEDVLWVHVAHQATCCKSLQYTFYGKKIIK